MWFKNFLTFQNISASIATTDSGFYRRDINGGPR